MRIRTIGAGLAALALASAANATGWNGFYVGINAGYADVSADTSREVITQGGYGGIDVTDIEAASLINLSSGTFIGGVQLGHNWSAGSIVFGLEGDFNFTTADDSTSVTVPWTFPYPGTLTTDAEFEHNWLATLRARFGTSMGSTLIYITGGAAFADVTFAQGFSETTFPVAYAQLSQSETMTGWTVGGGFECPVGEATSLKFEYLYVDLGSIEIPGSVGAGSTTVGSADVTDHIIRAGFNVKL